MHCPYLGILSTRVLCEVILIYGPCYSNASFSSLASTYNDLHCLEKEDNSLPGQIDESEAGKKLEKRQELYRKRLTEAWFLYAFLEYSQR